MPIRAAPSASKSILRGSSEQVTFLRGLIGSTGGGRL